MPGVLRLVVQCLGLMLILLGASVALALVWLLFALFTDPGSVPALDQVRAIVSDNTIETVSKTAGDQWTITVSENLVSVFLLIFGVIALFAATGLTRALVWLGRDLLRVAGGADSEAKSVDSLYGEREPL